MRTNRGAGIRVAVAGGTGRTGRRVVSALQRAGHQTVVMSRSSGVDLVAGQGIDRALADVDAVIDVTNTLLADDDAAGRLAAEKHIAADPRSAVKPLIGHSACFAIGNENRDDTMVLRRREGSSAS